jgi:hypothetical protein
VLPLMFSCTSVPVAAHSCALLVLHAAAATCSLTLPLLLLLLLVVIQA